MEKGKNHNIWFAAFVLLAAIQCTAIGGIIYVDIDAGGANNGTNWSDAYNCLQDALYADQVGDEIRVAAGVYKPDQGDHVTAGDRGATFSLTKNGVTV